MLDGSPNFKSAHPQAQKLMDEDFYYSSIEESGPFGSDDGGDTFSGFVQWREAHPADGPLVYLHQQLEEWGYPPYDLQESDPAIIQQYMQERELGITFIIGMDATIVSLAFSQLYLEGIIDASLVHFAILSLNRQLQPELISLWDESYQSTRKEQLGKMKIVLHRL